MNRKKRKGFTLVEVALFLAVTGLLFVGIVAGVQGSMFQQRYNDSVQSFAEFLRSIYSQTMNVENSSTKGGRSDQAIYGKLVVFGQELNFEGETNGDNAVFVYTVIGATNDDIGSKDVLKSLKDLDANVIVKDDSSGGLKFAGVAEQYFPRWGAEIQTTSKDYKEFKGAILIIRHPRSGTVFTFVHKDTDELDENLELNSNIRNAIPTNVPNPLKNLIQDGGFETNVNVDFCINPNPEKKSGQIRRDIRIVAGARNASGVEVIGQDDDTPETGNLCE